MSTKNDAEVIINGKVYRLSGYESPEYLQKIATYVNKKINSFAAEENYSRLSQEMKNVLLDINIAVIILRQRIRRNPSRRIRNPGTDSYTM